MSDIQYYVIDTETTGLKDGYHEIVEISIIRAKDKVQLSKKMCADYPERASLEALRICNKTFADLQEGDDPYSTMELCTKFFEEDGVEPNARCIVGHNIISFDKRFLHAFWGQFDKRFPADLYLDTMAMTKALIKTSGAKSKANLEAACDFCGIKKYGQKHTAKSDAQNTYLLWQDLVNNKKVDYLPFLKTFPHVIASPTQSNVEEEDF
jgi:DNA polymerase III epsilon subunit-like protein